MTLAQLAERCNISESSASRYLNGKVVPPADVAERILQELGTEIMANTAPEDKPPMATPPVLQIWEVYQEEINTLQAYHKNHVEMLKANHADHVETLKANHAAQVAAPPSSGSSDRLSIPRVCSASGKASPSPHT